MKLFLFLLFVSLTVSLKAEEDHHEHGEESHEHGVEPHHEEEGESHEGEEETSSSVGPGNAVTEADHETGFKLSDKALRTLALELAPIRPQASYTLPKTAIVYFKDEAGVYRLREGRFKLIEGDAEAQADKILFTPEPKDAFQRGDQIVIKGVPLLRVTELDAFGGSGEGHAH
jgi:hypothetical protein